MTPGLQRSSAKRCDHQTGLHGHKIKKNLFTRNLIICAIEIRKDLSSTMTHKEKCRKYSKLYPQQHQTEQQATACTYNRKKKKKP